MNKCALEADTYEYSFKSVDNSKAQFIISDRVVNCYLDAMVK